MVLWIQAKCIPLTLRRLVIILIRQAGEEDQAMFEQAIYAVWEEGQPGGKARINASSAGLDRQTLFF